MDGANAGLLGMQYAANSILLMFLRNVMLLCLIGAN